MGLPEILLLVVVVAGLSRPAVLTTDGGNDGLVIGRDGNGALAHPIEAGAGEVSDDVFFDGQLLIVRHVVEETSHAYAYKDWTVITVELAMSVAVVRVMRVDDGLLAHGV